MKFKGLRVKKGEAGYVSLLTEHGEDLWDAYNLIREGDAVSTVTTRKVSRGKAGDSETIRLKLEVKVEGVEYDVEGEELRIKGRNLTETEHVRLGAYHTLSITINKDFKLTKDMWDAVDMNRVYRASNPAATADLAVLLITDGFSQLFLIGSYATVTKATIEKHLPKKRGAAAAGYEKAWNSFLDKVYKAVVKDVNFDIVRCLVIAGPGFTKDAFKQYLIDESIKQQHRHMSDNRERMLTVSASSAYRHALNEVLTNPSIASQIQNTKALGEIKALDAFYAMLSNDSARAFYGPELETSLNVNGVIFVEKEIEGIPLQICEIGGDG